VRDIIKRSAGHFYRRAISKYALFLFFSISLALLEVAIGHHKTVLRCLKIEIQQLCSYSIRNHFLLMQLIYI